MSHIAIRWRLDSATLKPPYTRRPNSPFLDHVTRQKRVLIGCVYSQVGLVNRTLIARHVTLGDFRAILVARSDRLRSLGD